MVDVKTAEQNRTAVTFLRSWFIVYEIHYTRAYKNSSHVQDLAGWLQIH